MRKRKERRERSETLVSNPGEGDEDISQEEEVEEGGEKGFFACYLLCSLNPRFKGHTYIGFTINPRRRIRQHNGEIRCGAWKTKTKRPWEMIFCIYGFTTNVSALQFEWAWQHPAESLAVRKAAANFKSLSGIANKIKLAYTMLTLPPWQSLKLTVNFFSTKYTTHSAGCPSLPKQMKVQVCPMDELPCYTGQGLDETDNDGYGEAVYVENNNGDRHLNGPTDISVNNVSEYHCSNDQLRWIDDDGLRQQVDLLPPLEDRRLPFHLVDSPPRTPYSSCITSLVNTVEAVDDRDSLGLIEENHSKLRRTTEQQLEIPTAADNGQLPSTNCLLSSPEFGIQHPRDPFSLREEDHSLPICLVDSIMKPSSSRITGLTVKDRDPFGLIDDSSRELDQPTKQQATTPRAPNNDQPATSFGLAEEGKLGQTTKQQPPVTPVAANNYPPLSSKALRFCPDVEVINVSTPSSDCIIRTFRKKKRATSVCHKIIDLTESPNFIQL